MMNFGNYAVMIWEVCSRMNEKWNVVRVRKRGIRGHCFGARGYLLPPAYKFDGVAHHST